jgi:antirestriction factor ArdC-like protein
MQRTEKQDVYTWITSQIVSHLGKGVRPWVRPWNAEHAAGRITRPLRHNGKPYSGINVLSLWASAMAQNFAAPIWMTFKQASELDAHIRKGEKGSLVVYADSIKRRGTDEKTGDEIDREIPFLKGYTVFNVEQIKGLPEGYTGKPHLHSTLRPASNTRKSSSQPWVQLSDTAEIVRFIALPPMWSRCRHSRVSKMRTVTMQHLLMNVLTGRAARPGSTVTSAGIASGAKVTRSRNWSPNSGHLSCAPTLNSPWNRAKIMRPISQPG